MARIQSGARYVLLNVKAPESCLDISGGDNRSLIGYPPHGGLNQQWEFHRVSRNIFRIRSGTGLFLGIDGRAINGTRVVAGEEEYVWYVQDEPNFPGTIRLFVPDTRMNVDLSDDGNPTPGTPVTLWEAWRPGSNQLWRLEQVEEV
ncbi:carbohydrate-binding module family 13 protein [Scleroderma citrinum]